MRLLTIVFLLMLASCASNLTKEEASTTFIEKTVLNKDEAYNKILAYLAKNLKDSNVAIKLKDKDSGKIISRYGIECNELRAFADITSYVAYYTLEIDVKESKIKIEATGEAYSQFNINGSIISANSPMHSGHKDGAKKCAIKIKDYLLGALTSSQSNW